MSAITVLKGNVPHGPFTRAEVAEKLAQGEITLDSLAFMEGFAQWTPLRDVLARANASTPPPAPSFSPVMTAPAMPPPALMIPPASRPPLSPTGYSYAVTMKPPPHLVYAGFWLRFVSLFIDAIILSPLLIILCALYIGWMTTGTPGVQMTLGICLFISWLLFFLGQWLYFALLESSRGQATLGKRLMGVAVTDRQGNRIGFGRATGRYFGKIISILPLEIGFMMAGWTERKQALHDMLADTLVVRRPGE
jgi:uncharacterized RDD family membrane protein YckC